MIKTILALLLLFVGIYLITDSIRMSQARRISIETHAEHTKARDSAYGAGIGVGVGVVTWLVVGGVGIATGGAGFAVGAPLIIALGAGSGAVAGAAMGHDKVTQIQHIVPMYSTSAWVTQLVIGIVVTLVGALWARTRLTRKSSNQSLQPTAGRSDD
jgi:hypothetical protein